MRTVKGQEAIAIAETWGVPLYDAFYRHEVSVAQAKQFIDSRRDPQSFILENWPDSDDEAEQVLLHRFHTALAKGHLREARIMDVIAHPNGGVRIHPFAARLAADRLVDQGRIEITGEQDSEPYYHMVKNAHLSDHFFDGLDSLVCEDCAKLDFRRPFHQTCLTLILEHMREKTGNLDGIIEIEQDGEVDGGGLSRFIRVNSQLLSRGLDEARSRFQSVVKARLSRDQKTMPGQVDLDPTYTVKSTRDMDRAEVAKNQAEQPGVSNTHQGMGLRQNYEDGVGVASSLQDPSGSGLKTKISKQDLINYLRDVEIVDETGEIRELRDDHKRLTDELVRRDETIHQLEKQRTNYEKQFDEMKRDMDTLLAAMQIAKKRRPMSDNIIDVPMGE
ncbi:hypothetical protein [Alicyclobacillus ferrooxydans]|uniref:Uncharacterized protein n=1 Tax=Alicyclobacillus ferrooxydans TaxID=471514 RepID=A0A0P9F074_9BACL|nr:hypothetical protein [Alicyclobacillus ferrooxydans]KPV44735.1 hypothetical protein AN477_05435 [Alicyclobacillus ferrooxydans]